MTGKNVVGVFCAFFHCAASSNENAPIKFAMVVVMSKPRAVLNRRFLEGFIANVVRLVNIHIVVLL
jgi:hypothetical protein